MNTINKSSQFSNKSPVSYEAKFDDHKSSEDNETYNLSRIEASVCVIVLEAAIDELFVLSCLGDLPKVEVDLTYENIETRLGKRLPTMQIFDRNTIEPSDVTLYREKFVKFQKDLCYVEKIFRETITNLMKNNSYNCLVKYVNQHNLQVSEEEQLLESERVNRTTLSVIKPLIEKERREASNTIQTLSETIGVLKDQMEDIIFETKMKANYIESWENARIEQNNMRLDIEEECYLNIVNDKKNDIEREIRIDAEIEAFIRETQTEYQESIQMWMEQYDKDMEHRNTEIQMLKEERAEQFMRLQKISFVYEEHKKEIEDYLAVKEQHRKEEELIARKNRAATKIQAWWKGTMVRKCLGRFKKVKKGKNDKKKGKK